ncbi:MAG TPA: Gfo/Idh/MocA family oxidoreductase, partial [Thermoanaerobaculia bacterium]|nr:Gfo/Idh/MocA family oxidoreductase [Thermoanaerobaculia bacterium]
TVLKSRSKLLERKIEADQQVIAALVDVNGKRAVGVTRKFGPELSIPSELLWEIPGDRSLADIRLSDTCIALAEAYLPVPSCPVPKDLRRLVEESNPFLHRAVGSLPVEEPISRLEAIDRAKEVFIFGFGGYIREQVSRHFVGDVAAVVDYKADSIQRHAVPGVPVLNEAEAVMRAIAAADRPLAIIASYHSDHVPLAKRVLDANPRAAVFIEKPLAVELDDAVEISRRRAAGAWIDVGFNRRYAPFTLAAAEAFAERSDPMTITAVVKEVKVPPTHWYLWPNQGTRITGNACHWIDLAFSLVRAAPAEISVLHSRDDVSIAILFKDGSLFTLVASDSGSDLAGVEETIDMRAGDTSVFIHDYRECVIKRGASVRTLRRRLRDRGHDAMYRDLRKRWRQGLPPAYPQEAMFPVAYMTFHAARMFAADERHFVCADFSQI